MNSTYEAQREKFPEPREMYIMLFALNVARPEVKEILYREYITRYFLFHFYYILL